MNATSPIRLELPTPFPVGPVNAYLFKDPEPILVDTGVKSEASWQALTTALANEGLAVTDLKRIIITHPHVDHSGAAKQLADASGAPVYCSEVAYDWMAQTREMWRLRVDYYAHHFLPYVGLPTEAFQAVIDSMTHASKTADSVPPDQLVTFPLDGTLEMGGLPWQTLYLPGHTNYQTCFYQPDTRQFLSADMLLAKTPTPIVERPLIPNAPREPGLPKFLRSLTLVEQLAIDTVYPGHGNIFGQHRTVVAKQRRRIERRKNECLHLVREGYTTVGALVAKMYAHFPPRHRYAGLWMLVGYLDLLKAEGKLTETVVDGLWHYAAV